MSSSFFSETSPSESPDARRKQSQTPLQSTSHWRSGGRSTRAAVSQSGFQRHEGRRSPMWFCLFRRFAHVSFIGVVLRPTGLELLLSNSTFLTKISHSSQQLRTDNIRGSFLG